MTDRELMQDALDALNNFDKGNHGMRWQVPLIKALRARLSQPEPAECDGGQCGIGGYCKECPKTKPEPEPVAWRFHDRNMWCYVDHLTDLPQDKFKPLYTAPPQREWVGLTDDERLICLSSDVDQAIANTEAKLREKNG